MPLLIALLAAMPVTAGPFPDRQTLPDLLPHDIVERDTEIAEVPMGLSGLSGAFIENDGQLGNPEVRYYGSIGGLQVGLANGAILLNLAETQPARGPSAKALEARPDVTGGPAAARGILLRIAFEGANPVLPVGRGEMPYRSNFFLGNDPAQWRTNVRSYREIVYEELYDGIDLVYRVGPEGPKYDVIVRAGADPGLVHWRYEGVEGIRLDGSDLVVRTGLGDLREAPPVAQQEGMPVPCAFSLLESSAGFSCTWNPSLLLVIDPLVYATFLGGSSFDVAAALALDAAGNAYVAGYTDSADFPTTPGAYDTTYNGGDYDVFAAKLDRTGSALLYVTYLGGSSSDWAPSLAVDAAGNAYLAGQTNSTDFPTTVGAYDTTYNGNEDAFVAKLNATGGTLLYATLLGGSFGDGGRSLDLDAAGNAYVSGLTASADFPTTPVAYDTTANGGADAFVAKLSATGSALLYGTYLGGSLDDWSYSLALDAAGNAYVAGQTESPDFPTTPGAYDTTYDGGGSYDVFVAKLVATGPGLLYATYLGGSSQEWAYSIAVDAAGNAYVTGLTGSPDFPTTPGAYDTTHNGSWDGFVAKLDSTGSALVYATYLGGSMYDGGASLALDADGNAYVWGATGSADFPTTPGAYDTGGGGAFIAKLDGAGNTLLYATFFSGGLGGGAPSLALDAARNVYVTGVTGLPDFPATPGAYDTTYNGGSSDAFVAKLNLTVPSNTPPIANAGPDQQAVRDILVVLNGSGSYDPDGDSLSYQWTQSSGPPANLSGENASLATFIPTELGMYVFNLTVDDGFGGNATDEVAVTVAENAVPIVVITVSPPSGIVGTIFTFDGSASSDDGTIVSYSWDFGDGTTGSGAQVTHRYARNGTFAVTLTIRDDGGLEATATTTTLVLPIDTGPGNRPDDGTIVGITVVTIGVIIAVLWRLRVLWFPWFIMWCYTKLRRDEVLDNITRGEIFGFVRFNPGESYSEIKRSLGLAAGELTYHVAVLERMGLIRSVTDRARKLFYPVGTPVPENGGDLRGLQVRMIGILTEDPGIAVSDLAALLGVNRQVALYHLRKLVSADRVRLERKMTRLRAYPVQSTADR